MSVSMDHVSVAMKTRRIGNKNGYIFGKSLTKLFSTDTVCPSYSPLYHVVGHEASDV